MSDLIYVLKTAIPLVKSGKMRGFFDFGPTFLDLILTIFLQINPHHGISIRDKPSDSGRSGQFYSGYMYEQKLEKLLEWLARNLLCNVMYCKLFTLSILHRNSQNILLQINANCNVSNGKKVTV